jgi:hypothetical protein
MNRTYRIRLALGGVLITSLGVSYVWAAPRFSAWSAPTNLGANINSAFDEGGPAISKDGLSLYFQTNRPGGEGNTDIWVSQRESPTDAWGDPKPLGPNVNTAFNDVVPNLSRDGHFLFFTSDRPGGAGNLDLWVSWRAHTHDDFGWQPPVNLAVLNTASIDAGPGYFENDEAGLPQLFFASDRPGGAGALDIYVSEQNADGSFGPPRPVTELNGPFADQAPDVRHDGLELFMQSNRSGNTDIWVSTRETVFEPWSDPLNLGPVVNSLFVDGQPSLSSDRKTLYFFSNRPGGLGGNDLYVTTRTKGGQ